MKKVSENVNNCSRGGVEDRVTEITIAMKKLLATLAVGAFAFIGTASQADAEHYGYGGGYDRGYDRNCDSGYGRRPDNGYHHRRPPANHIYISSYRHGRPVYTEKYFVGWDDCGRPRFAYRTVVGQGHCDTPRYGYGGSRGRVNVSFGF